MKFPDNNVIPCREHLKVFPVRGREEVLGIIALYARLNLGGDGIGQIAERFFFGVAIAHQVKLQAMRNRAIAVAVKYDFQWNSQIFHVSENLTRAGCWNLFRCGLDSLLDQRKIQAAHKEVKVFLQISDESSFMVRRSINSKKQ
jgi:hypothetical protein